MNESMKLITTIIFATVIGGCAGGRATAYIPIGATGGYYHQKISENEYNIGFQGNNFTEPQRVNDYATLRAAEIGSKLGFTHFVVKDTSEKPRTQIVNMGIITTVSSSANALGNNTSFNGKSRTKNDSEIDVFYFDDMPERRYLEVFIIQDVMKEIKTKYGITP